MTTPIAIAVSDLHLQEKPPLSRAEKDWYAVQAFYLTKLRQLSEELNVPILCGGDVLDRWKVSPELINFSIDYLPNMLSVPGQHDLPYHSLEEINKSGYRTLEKAGRLAAGTEGGSEINGMVIDCFPWGEDLAPPSYSHPLCLNVLLAHKHVWTKESRYFGAPEEGNVHSLAPVLQHYDVAIFGDNHKGFIVDVQGCTVINAGTFIRRSSAEKDYRPGVGIIYSNGDVKRHYWDTSNDCFAETDAPKQVDKREFTEVIEEIRDVDIDYRVHVKRLLDQEKPPERTREIVMEILEGEIK